MKHICQSESDTEKLARQMAANARAPHAYCLSGDLGAGKTAFARAFIRELCGSETNVPSPTFTLVQTYGTGKGPLWHFDLYRLERPDDVLELGWDEALADGLVLVEWPEKAGPYLPPSRTDIHIAAAPDQSRILTVTTHDR